MELHNPLEPPTPFTQLFERRIVFLKGPIRDNKADQMVAP